ncbi:MOSC domain-containing protein [Nocardioides marmorisolisilvae]|uniref:MOSC domain-containing protein n=1 Tax=Nocardioides marmorisolisilvae TaxID=1542737 RepID=UPI0016181D76|nr:MOSC N-terminal beta barrel domain-containing protein [Nocardioides marmorisolisilvae]
MSDPAIARVAGLGIHPVKSTAIRPVERATVHPWGLAGDRRWMVVDADGTLVSARELRELFLVTADTPETEPGLGAPLRLRARGFDPIDVVEPDTDLIDLRMHSNDLQGRPAAESANTWIRDVTGRRDLRLIWCDDPTRRTFDRDWALPSDHAPYTDSCPVTLASLSSLRQLNDWIAQDAVERGDEPPAPLPIGRFRANVVVDGAEAFAEDGWARLRIGDVWFRQPKRVDRCVMTTISATDLSSTKEPIRTLARYRLADQKTWFAVHLVPEGPGTIVVGDEVVVD